MSLLDEAEALSSNAGARCTVGVLLERMTPAERAELTEALGSVVQSTALARALAKRGHKIRSGTVQRHRRAECECR